MSVEREFRIRIETAGEYAVVQNPGGDVPSNEPPGSPTIIPPGNSAMCAFASPDFRQTDDVGPHGQVNALNALVTTLDANAKQMVAHLNRLIALQQPVAAELLAVNARIAQLEAQTRNLVSGNGQ